MKDKKMKRRKRSGRAREKGGGHGVGEGKQVRGGAGTDAECGHGADRGRRVEEHALGRWGQVDIRPDLMASTVSTVRLFYSFLLWESLAFFAVKIYIYIKEA
jgi:hypothetical protein